MKTRQGERRTAIICLVGLVAFIGLSIWGLIWLSRIPNEPVHQPSPLHGSGKLAASTPKKYVPSGDSLSQFSSDQKLLRSVEIAALLYHKKHGSWPANDEQLQRDVREYKMAQILAQRDVRFKALQNGSLEITLKSGFYDDRLKIVPPPVSP